MAHLQYMPGDPRLVDQLVYELKSKGIFDQFRKECIADVDTRPAYQNLRQRVENSVSTFLSRQTWQPDMNKNQLREKLRKHILDGNYLEQGVERIVDQVVNPKVATVFIPKVEDLVYTVLGITRKKSPAETSNGKVEDLLPNDLEAVSPGSVKSNDEKNEQMDVDSLQDSKMEIDEEKSKLDTKDDSIVFETDKENTGDIQLPSNGQNDDIDKCNIPLPSEEIKPENIPSPDTSPPKVELEKIELPKEPIISTDIPLPNDMCKDEKDQYFKPLNSEDDDSSSGSSLRRNMSPLTPIRNFNNENSCDAQQAFENESIDKSEDKKEPSSFRFKIDAKSSENSSDAVKPEAKKEAEINLSYQFKSQVNINNFNTPLYEDSSNSNNLQIDYESDANSKANIEIKVPENDQISEESKKEKKAEEKKSSHKSSHRSRDSHKHSTSKDKKSDSKHSNSRDSSRHDKSKSSKDDSKSKSSEKDKSKDKNEKKDSSRDSSRRRSSHKSSHKDSKSHRSSSTSGRHSSKHSDDKKSSSTSSNHKDKDKSSDKSKDSKSSSHRSDKDRKSSSSSRSDKTSSKGKDVKDKDKKSKKENDDHYSLSGRGNPNRRSTDRDSNDGSTSSKGSHNPSSSKSSNNKKDSKSSSKSESTSTSDSTSPSDKENIREHSSKTKETLQHKPIVRIERQLEMAVASPPRLPFVPDVTIKKPKFAANLQEAKRLMKMRKFLDEEQKRMNQEAALLLEFQANVRPSMSQVYSSIPGPELEFACVSNIGHSQEMLVQSNDNINHVLTDEHDNVNVLNIIADERHVLNQEHNIDSVLSEENNINNDVKQEHDNLPTVGNIEKAHYTNNELLTVLNDAKDDYANNTIDYEMLIDDINKTKTYTLKNIQDTVKTIENNDQVNSDNVQTYIEITEINQSDNKSVESIESSYTNEAAEELFEDKKVSNSEKEVINEKFETTNILVENKESLTEVIDKTPKQDTKKLSDLFEVTIITEELSEYEESLHEYTDTEKSKLDNEVIEEVKTQKDDTPSEITTRNENENRSKINGENELHYFGEHEKYNAELERAQFNNFFKEYNMKTELTNKLYLINCNSYEENVVREVSKELGVYEIVSYHKNGHLKLPINKNVIKDINISTEISLPIDVEYENIYDGENIAHNAFSSEKSECSFELSSDYDSKLEEMVNRTSRQEIMEIILGNVIDTSPSKMPRIDYLTDLNIDSEYENGLKRKICEISEETTTSVNNNRPVLTPNKIRKLSTDQITSTTQENEEIPTNKTQNITRSKYLGKARRVGLPRPKRTIQPNSPSSDKSIENYEQNTPTTPNGKLKRSKVQRYDTSDLYKPKLHYLSRRTHVT